MIALSLGMQARHCEATVEIESYWNESRSRPVSVSECSAAPLVFDALIILKDVERNETTILRIIFTPCLCISGSVGVGGSLHSSAYLSTYSSALSVQELISGLHASIASPCAMILCVASAYIAEHYNSVSTAQASGART